jgi:hypothetical protein
VLRLLRTASRLDALQTNLGAEGALTVALELFTLHSELPEVVRQDAVAVLSNLCRDHEANQKIFRQERGLSALKGALVALRSADHTLPR